MLAVAATASLEGLTATALASDAARASFASVLASSLNVAASRVVITGVADGGATARHHRRRRRLLVATVDVGFTVASSSYAAAAALASSLTGLDTGALLTALNAAGLAATGVLISLPSLGTQAAAPPPPKPPTPPGAVLPTVSAVRVSPGAALAVPSARITLTADVTSATPASLVLEWSVRSSAVLDLRDASRVGTPLNTRTLGLLPGALQAGAAYTFVLSARDAGGAASASVDIITLQVPTGGAVEVSSPGGAELVTRFNVSTSRASWTDANPDLNGDGVGEGDPLQYMFSYVVADEVRALTVHALHCVLHRCVALCDASVCMSSLPPSARRALA
jgi:hypothetical protein